MGVDSILLIFEAVVKEDSFWAIGKSDKTLIEGWGTKKRYETLQNVTMPMNSNAKERSEVEWRALLRSAGFKVTQIYGYNLAESIIEAVKD